MIALRSAARPVDGDALQTTTDELSSAGPASELSAEMTTATGRVRRQYRLDGSPKRISESVLRLRLLS